MDSEIEKRNGDLGLARLRCSECGGVTRAFYGRADHCESCFRAAALGPVKPAASGPRERPSPVHTRALNPHPQCREPADDFYPPAYVCGRCWDAENPPPLAKL